MVKNTTGGTKTKGLARKHVKSAGGGNAALRLPEEQLEVIVAVGSMLGNGMCEVFNDKDERFIAHIRNKFKGRHKRANLITKNSIILCGYREWEKPYKNLDVIFIYDDYNINQLRENPTINIINILKRISNNTYHTHDTHDNDFVFTNEEELLPDTNTNTNTNTLYNNIDFTDI
jgi:hypothetical protein